MKKINLLTSLLICIGATTVHAQAEPPQLLVGAAPCLMVKNFLPSSRATKLTLGYVLDEKSYPGDKVVYLVSYKAPARSNGLVFAVFLTEGEGVRNFNIQNNASFELSKNEPGGLDFKSPPLGGTWTQEHLASAVKKIEKQPRYAVPVKDLYTADSSISCESYTDPKN